VWFLRELARLILRIALATAVALALAALLSAVSVNGFDASARILCITFGCILLALAGVGRGSNVERYVDRNVTKVAWGTIPGFDALRTRPEDPRLAPGIVFFLSGLALIAVGVTI
jgi:hypothetical protein